MPSRAFFCKPTRATRCQGCQSSWTIALLTLLASAMSRAGHARSSRNQVGRPQQAHRQAPREFGERDFDSEADRAPQHCRVAGLPRESSAADRVSHPHLPAHGAYTSGTRPSSCSGLTCRLPSVENRLAHLPHYGLLLRRRPVLVHPQARRPPLSHRFESGPTSRR